MPMHITPTSLTITQLLGSPNEQYSIPAYQRRYSWHERQLWELIDDIRLIEDSETHLLGSIVCLTGHHTAGINKLELVDGQQRLTTISILLQCILDRLKSVNELTEAQDIERLLNARALGASPVRKIALDSMDAAEFGQLANGGALENPEKNTNLSKAFALFRQWVSEQDVSNLRTFLYRLKNQAIVIRLDVGDAKDAFKLFETINNRGLRLSPTDIVKNFILGNAARLGARELALAKTRWAELIRHLDGTSSEAFFRHFLCAQLRQRITISYVISNFKKLFMKQVADAARLPDRHQYDDEPAVDEETEESTAPTDDVDQDVEPTIPRVSFDDFLLSLVRSAKVYGELVSANTGIAVFDRHLRNLKLIKAYQTYGFLMALRVGGCSDANFIQVLKMTESFLLRRHICRERSNENDTLFAKLCGIDFSDPILAVREEYRKYCPSDENFRQDFAAFEFGSGLIDRARYCLEQFEMHRHGQHVELIVAGADDVQVEHIIPMKIRTKKAKDEFGDWPTYLGDGAESRHSRFISRIGNLSLFAGALNISASNNPYERKKNAYRTSAIQITRSLPQDYPEFRYQQVEERSSRLADLAVTLWPAP